MTGTRVRRLIGPGRRGAGRTMPAPCFVSMIRITADRASALEMRPEALAS